MNDKLLLEAREVAHLLGISLRKLDDMVSKEEAPPCIRIGRVRKWRLDEINRWIDGRFRQPEADTTTHAINGKGDEMNKQK